MPRNKDLPLLLVFSLAALLACNPSSDDDDTAQACVALQAGRWASTGGCFGMAMDADLTPETGGCSFTFSNWNMTMDVPEGGVVVDDQVTMTGSGWEDCTATAEADGTSFTGSCASASCAFAMALQ